MKSESKISLILNLSNRDFNEPEVIRNKLASVGFVSEDETETYYMAVIDILQKYDFGKAMERRLKTCLGKDKVSLDREEYFCSNEIKKKKKIIK